MAKQFVQIQSFDNYIEANIVLGLLQEEGINCHIKDENIITVDPLLSPMLGGMKLMVYHTQVERATDIINNAREQYLKTYQCPVCKKRGIESVTEEKGLKKKPGKWRQIINALLNQSEQEKSRYYRCSWCGNTFHELPRDF